MVASQVKDVLALLMTPPSLLECGDAFSLVSAHRYLLFEPLKLAALWKWYCKFLVICDAIETSIDLLPLWRQLIISLQGVKQAFDRGTSHACCWVLDTPDDLRHAVDALRIARASNETSSPRELYMATISGVAGTDHLALLRHKWDVDGHKSNMATCFVGEAVTDSSSNNFVSLHTRDGQINVRLLWEMRRFRQESGKPETRAVCLAAYPISERIGICWDGTEEIPKLLCISATSGIDMFSSDIFRFDGKPGATRRGSLTHAVEEDDLRRKLCIAAIDTALSPLREPITGAERVVHDDANYAFVFEEDADPLDEITSEASEEGYCKEVEATANALRRFDSGQQINLLFALHGESFLLLSPSLGDSRSDQGEDSEESESDHISAG